eukprot:TRINITY_DN24283_c0_g2_i1.p1 TRINITY_DN24283_c0_g2~~TRINITY_DN24283_c0_g2_i1.p1  ORF type:complete len:371 (-),score=85.47 TRINITY_DN24283_c0_g2_i1:139-1251(-)
MARLSGTANMCTGTRPLEATAPLSARSALSARAPATTAAAAATTLTPRPLSARPGERHGREWERYQELLQDLLSRRRRVYKLEEVLALAYEAEQEHLRLRHETSTLEEALQAAREEAELWRLRFADKDRTCASVAASELWVRRELEGAVQNAADAQCEAGELRRGIEDVRKDASLVESRRKAVARKASRLARQLERQGEELAAAHEQKDAFAQEAQQYRLLLQDALENAGNELRRAQQSHAEAMAQAQERENLLASRVARLEAQLVNAQDSYERSVEEAAHYRELCLAGSRCQEFDPFSSTSEEEAKALALEAQDAWIYPPPVPPPRRAASSGCGRPYAKGRLQHLVEAHGPFAVQNSQYAHALRVQMAR